jgi:hypothetical protein
VDQGDFFSKITHLQRKIHPIFKFYKNSTCHPLKAKFIPFLKFTKIVAIAR